MKKNIWKISTFVLLAIIATFIAFSIVINMGYDEDMEGFVDPFADMPSAGEIQYTENGERIVTSADLQLMMQQMNEASMEAGKQVSAGMTAVTGAVDEISNAMDDPDSEINSFADNIATMMIAVKKDLPALEEKLKALQAKIEAKIAEANKKFTTEDNSDVKTPNNK